MENASKAIVIAGAVMIAIIILSIGVFLHSSFRQNSDEYVTQLDIIEIRKYNSNFDSFLERKNITIQEIITVQGIAKQKELGTKVYVKFITGSNREITDWTEDDKNLALSNYIQQNVAGVEINLFSCTNIEYFDDGRISAIYFQQIS